jgi:hypothetical protein
MQRLPNETEKCFGGRGPTKPEIRANAKTAWERMMETSHLYAVREDNLPFRLGWVIAANSEREAVRRIKRQEGRQSLLLHVSRLNEETFFEWLFDDEREFSR